MDGPLGKTPPPPPTALHTFLARPHPCAFAARDSAGWRLPAGAGGADVKPIITLHVPKALSQIPRTALRNDARSKRHRRFPCEGLDLFRVQAYNDHSASQQVRQSG